MQLQLELEARKLELMKLELDLIERRQQLQSQVTIITACSAPEKILSLYRFYVYRFVLLVDSSTRPVSAPTTSKRYRIRCTERYE